MSLEASLAVGSRSTLCLPWQETTRIIAKLLLLAPTHTARAEEQTLHMLPPTRDLAPVSGLQRYIFISDLKPHPGPSEKTYKL